MIRGNELKVIVDGVTLAACTSCSVKLSQGLTEYTPIPGTTDDDGFAHYNPDMKAWSVSADTLYITDDTMAEKILGDNLDVTLKINLGYGKFLTGTAMLSEVSISAERMSIAKMTCKFNCNNFPTLTAS